VYENDLVPTTLLVLSLVGLLFLLNGLRPTRLTLLLVPSFFSAWLTVELAPQLLVLTLLSTTVLVSLGGAGWGLFVTAIDIAILVLMIAQAERAADVADAALVDWGARPTYAPSRLRRFFVPMAFSDPLVERTVDVRYGEGPRQKLDVYRRTDHPTGCPTLLQVHGGAWVIGDKKEQGRPLMLHLAKKGWVCFAPNYRLAPKGTWPDHLYDVKQALVWVKEHAEEYGADPGFVVVTGGSAGGHLASLLALTPNDPAWQPGFEDEDTTVQGCVPYYGVYDIADDMKTKAGRDRRKRFLAKLVMKGNEDAVFEAASPLRHVNPDAPPIFVIHGRNDTLAPVQEARELVRRLRETSTQPVIYLELPGTQHGFDVFPSIRSDHVVRAVGRFCEGLRERALRS
jgi:acetyl esterase/lipase